MARTAADTSLARGTRVRPLNRKPARAERLLACRHGWLEVAGLDALQRPVLDAVLVVGATASPEPLVPYVDVELDLTEHTTPLVLLGIEPPENVEPHVRELPLTLLGVDDLGKLCPIDIGTRKPERDLAETMAVEEADRLAYWLRPGRSAAITKLHSSAETLRKNELRRSASRLCDLTAEKLDRGRALIARIVNKS